MEYVSTTLSNLLQQTAFFNLTVGNYIMIDYGSWSDFIYICFLDSKAKCIYLKEIMLNDMIESIPVSCFNKCILFILSNALKPSDASLPTLPTTVTVFINTSFRFPTLLQNLFSSSN
mgnify:CR=1 FL=1